MKEIVAGMIEDRYITNDRKRLEAALVAGVKVGWLPRQYMSFMAACDLGENWRKLANGPTLFCIDDNGEPCKGPENVGEQQ